MNMISKGLLVVVAMTALAGCQRHNSDALENGRPVAPSGQSVPGGPVGSGPVGQPQS
ncbi:hypothetical protein [Rosenbergiella collisarenosi]|uniref:hypothetical protein n=1 Tax=Rosenbergiella collisarenosi TaxID=1544695 RepID=UPI0018DFFC92|nr:hypothetical protein [Rosenbergiella collisarenosi]MBT0720198.1 hypothetical protein [Rosenbergiella collisarenosi]